MQKCTHERDAAYSNSGLSVDHSDPGLKVPTLPATAGRTPEARENGPQDNFQCPAGYLQPKSGRGFGGSAPISAEGAVPFSFISKRVSVPRAIAGASGPSARVGVTKRKCGCGQWTILGIRDDGTRRYGRMPCKCWDCGYCGPRRARRYRHAICQQAERHRLRVFITLTLDPKKLDGEDSTRYLNRCFAELRKKLRRKYGCAPTYIRVLEYQKNGTAHFHILLDRFVEIEWLRRTWQKVGGGWMVNAKFVDVHRVGAYVSKYLSKDLLMSAPKGARRVTTSQTIRMFEKTSCDTAWALLRTTLDYLRTTFASVTKEDAGTDGILLAFEVSAFQLP
jgi:hypothetical protein